MSYEIFTDWAPNTKTARTLHAARGIIAEYQAQDITLTLRQLYYQFVSRDLLANTDKSYKRLGNIVSRGRQAGMLDWEAIEDRARRPVMWSQDKDMDTCLRRALRNFRLPRQDGQRTYVELWVEKDALASVLEPIAAQYHITLMVNRGYSSASAMKAAADRIRRCCSTYGSTRAAVLYLGDLDPSGEDMVRDIRERLELFTNSGMLVNTDDILAGDVNDDYDGFEPDEAREARKPYLPIAVKKLALTAAQVQEHDPPPNPTKLTDSRAKGFIEKYGYNSWEVDALPPVVLRELIEDAFTEHLDVERIHKIKERETAAKAELEKWLATR